MELFKDLISIGFTEYEARVYLALLRDNPATGYQIGKNAGVPRSMVYEALGRLDVRGAVLKTEDRRGNLYRPVPPEVLLDRYEQEQLSLISNLRENLHRLYSASAEERLWSINGHNAILVYAQQMIETARSEILLVLSDPHLETLAGKLQQACESGVAVKTLLTGLGHLDCGQVARHPPLESQLQQLNDMLVVVADGRECLIANTDMEEMKATITTNRNLVVIARQFVWMEFFAQRIYSRLGQDLLGILEPEERWMYTRADG